MSRPEIKPYRDCLTVIASHPDTAAQGHFLTDVNSPPGYANAAYYGLTLTSALPNTQAGSYNINYDPLLMSDGIAATDDPVLLFRSPTYALSFTRRIRDL